jgi:hypothetical protein
MKLTLTNINLKTRSDVRGRSRGRGQCGNVALRIVVDMSRCDMHRQKGHVMVLQYHALRTIHFPTILGPPCNGLVKALSSFGLPWMLLPYFVHFILVKKHFHSMNYATNPQPVNAISSPFFAQNGMD